MQWFSCVEKDLKDVLAEPKTTNTVFLITSFFYCIFDVFKYKRQQDTWITVKSNTLTDRHKMTDLHVQSRSCPPHWKAKSDLEKGQSITSNYLPLK